MSPFFLPKNSKAQKLCRKCEIVISLAENNYDIKTQTIRKEEIQIEAYRKMVREGTKLPQEDRLCSRYYFPEEERMLVLKKATCMLDIEYEEALWRYGRKYIDISLTGLLMDLVKNRYEVGFIVEGKNKRTGKIEKLMSDRLIKAEFLMLSESDVEHIVFKEEIDWNTLCTCTRD